MRNSPSTMCSSMRRRGRSRNLQFRRCAISATSFGRNSTHCTSRMCSPDGLRRGHSGRRRTEVAPPTNASQPRLAAGCRWGGTEEDRVILFPEGALKLQGTGRQILERCDGRRTFAEIIAELQKEFGKTDPEKIRGDISMFLEQLQKKRIVDY